ncbi:MAG: hypothetical protein ACO3MB_12835, partial [Saprospiraceae bacterium]
MRLLPGIGPRSAEKLWKAFREGSVLSNEQSKGQDPDWTIGYSVSAGLKACAQQVGKKSKMAWDQLNENGYLLINLYDVGNKKITELMNLYIDKLYNQFLIKIGKDNLSNPPEVSGLITEKILSIKGYVVNRTFR